MRNAPGKKNCLVLDFAGNIERHGPIDRVNPYDPSRNGGGQAPVKVCPKCRLYIYAGYQQCPHCGHKFPPPVKELYPVASTKSIISQKDSYWVEIEKTWQRHKELDEGKEVRSLPGDDYEIEDAEVVDL